MTTPKIRIGISAIFDPRITAHGRTLLRSLELFRNHCRPDASITYEFADDNAKRGTAISVAEMFAKKSVDVVVGHFSSDAAVGAVPIYEANGIPLLLPAATASVVTEENSNAFRICPNDTALARRLLSFVLGRGWSTIHLSSDDSLHGTMLAREIENAASSKVTFTTIASSADALVFAGRLASSAQFVSTTRMQQIDAPIILTDDAASPSLPRLIDKPGELYIVSFAPAHAIAQGQRFSSLYRLTYGVDPDVYGLESFAALQVASKARACGAGLLRAISEGTFDTVVGPVHFLRGERAGAPHGLWRVESMCLVFQELLSDTTHLTQTKGESVLS
ncbi:hypothetical protein A8H39_00610 [Paraburkholderia fungorum]|uniref:ABC transporter substrate-binding protein n=1 Tax=Paraburkholderia fungorum TaxID=134537 RepID=UPI000695BA83|nr:ABC transporter substrate-binding protein [Paraburkholderia fungorum]PNE59684.1 hypothetical protein A8H39_00610 [Paraburkholderia fungorum]